MQLPQLTTEGIVALVLGLALMVVWYFLAGRKKGE
jgi:hypothetical protein